MNPDTCVAFATPPGTAGLAVLRFSGCDAARLADKLFLPGPPRPAEDLSAFLPGQTLQKQAGYTCRFGTVYHPKTLRPIDQAIATRFVAPHSYTGEDVVELSIHGGRAVRESLLQAALEAGARLAGPGEFTERAFLNGKLDLVQAEAVMDLIEAEGERQAQQALAQLEGALSASLAAIRSPLLDARAQLELALQYPEHEESLVSREALLSCIRQSRMQCENLLQTFGQGRLVREGLRVALAGEPNSGKSTLLNLLSGFDRAIVTEIPGTTRDTLEQTIRIGGYCLTLIDTAGLRETQDQVEKLGVARSYRAFDGADFLLWLFPQGQRTGREEEIWNQLSSSLRILPILSQADRLSELDLRAAEFAFSEWISSVQHSKEQIHAGEVGPKSFPTLLSPLVLSQEWPSSLEVLRSLLQEACQAENSGDQNAVVLTTQRQYECLSRARQALLQAEQSEIDLPDDLLSLCMQEAAEALGEITGDCVQDELWREVFARFCVGK